MPALFITSQTQTVRHSHVLVTFKRLLFYSFFEQARHRVPIFLRGSLSSRHLIRTPSLAIRLLPLNSASFGYAMKGGTTKSPAHLSTETAPSLLLAMFLDASFSSTGVCNSLFECCVQHCFKCLPPPPSSWESPRAHLHVVGMLRFMF